MLSSLDPQLKILHCWGVSGWKKRLKLLFGLAVIPLVSCCRPSCCRPYEKIQHRRVQNNDTMAHWHWTLFSSVQGIQHWTLRTPKPDILSSAGKLSSRNITINMTTRAQKRRKIEEEKRRCSLEGVFWDPTMFPQLGQFLSINDTTNLGHTCKEMKRVVDTVCDAATSGNSSLAKIVWEKRRKTMIGYQGDDSDYDPNCCQVWQIQWFCFCLVSKKSLQKMEVNISLDNIVWIERHNWLDPATMNPSPTWVKVIITARSFPAG